jgi:hypothetical protein
MRNDIFGNDSNVNDYLTESKYEVQGWGHYGLTLGH